jgi:hypothetical protein
MSLVIPFLTITSLLATPAAAVHLQAANGLASQQFGGAISELGDQNGDGRWEFLVGSPYFNGSGVANGRAYLWFGSEELTFNPEMTYTGQNGELFGYAVARVGDLNDDGVDDFAIGAPGADVAGDGAGRVYVYFGGVPLAASADIVLEGPAPGDSLGFALSAAGDFNHDGVDDLLVGAPASNRAGFRAGAAYVYYGGATIASQPDVYLPGEIGGDRFGWSVTDCGRFTGTPADCIAVGAPNNGSYAGLNSGVVYVFAGTTTPIDDPDTTPEYVFTSSGTTGGRFGFAVRGIGFWDYDSYPDLAVGAPWHSGRTGRVEIFFGGTAAGPTADRYVNGETGADFFGWSLADAGDIADNNRDDLVIGAPAYAGEATAAGRAYVYPGGSVSGFNDVIVLPANGIMPGTLADDRFGWAVSGAGDFDGDGTGDWAVGAPWGNDDDNVVAGYVKVYDSSGTQVATELRGWAAVWEPDGAVALVLRVAPGEPGGQLRVERVLSVGAGDGGAAIHAGEWPLDGRWHGRDAGAAAALAAAPAAARLGYHVLLVGATGTMFDLGVQPGPAAPPAPAPAALAPPVPNPANPATTIRFRVPVGIPTTCTVHDLRGARVRLLHDGSGTGAWQQLRWDGRDARGRLLSAGVYLIRLTAGEERYVQRLVLAP